MSVLAFPVPDERRFVLMLDFRGLEAETVRGGVRMGIGEHGEETIAVPEADALPAAEKALLLMAEVVRQLRVKAGQGPGVEADVLEEYDSAEPSA